MTDYYVNINKHIIGSNARNNTDDPPVRISKGKSGKGTYCHEVQLPAGSRVVYSPHEPILKCGARLVIVCPTEPEIVR
jgi:hypothetical protein